MKPKYFLFIAVALGPIHSFSQVNKTLKSTTQKTIVAAPVTRETISVKPVGQESNVVAPKPTYLESAIVTLTTGDDGKDPATYWGLELTEMQTGREEAGYSESSGRTYNANESATLQIPVGDFRDIVSSRPMFSDFKNGGRISLKIRSGNPDTWKIQTLAITLNFQNEKPRTITWNEAKALSQDNKEITYLFDANFNPIQ